MTEPSVTSHCPAVESPAASVSSSLVRALQRGGPVSPRGSAALTEFFRSPGRVAFGCALMCSAACTSSIVGAPGGAGATPSGGAASSNGAGASGSTTGQGGSTGGSGAAAASGGTGTSSGGTGAAGTGTGGTGAVGTGGTAGTGGVAPPFVNPPPFEPAPGMLRRLTRTQFRNALHDLLGADVDISQLDADSWDGNFAVIGAATVATSELGVEQYQTAVENAVGVLFTDSAARGRFIGCTPTGAASDACVRGFVQSLGLRAWRRPLDAGEVDRLATVAANAASVLGDPVEGARWATVAILTSPSFLYRPELGAIAADGALRLTDYETASRLAFLVWNSLPDQSLLDQAASGALRTADGIRSAATRLLDAPAGREAISQFAEEFMRLDRIATQAKDPTLFPAYAPALQQGMARDIRDTWAVLAFDDHASVLELFATPKVVVNQELAALYGLDPAGLTSTTFQVRTLPADGPRLGLLSKAGFLSEYANQKEGSPTLRGKWMREQLLCTPIPPPPPDVNATLVDPPADMPLTKRQRLELHRTNKTCAGCHDAMDPLGLPLETFDAVGAYRTTERGLDIDPTGDFDDVAVDNARALGVAASADAAVAVCLARKYYTYAMGHAERSADGSVLNDLTAAFVASGFQLRDLVLDVVTNDAFSVVAPQP